jgi:AcrR family transcriptional regulator
MKSIKQQKLDVLFRFCNQYGFEQTVDEITAGIGISKKTFFNRYQNREEMTKMVQQYWRELFKIRF